VLLLPVAILLVAAAPAQAQTAALAAHLRSLGIEVQTGVAHTGVVGVLRGGRTHALARRADRE
jgi:metal-dependent amidase/aminoacylase/carboxypeptidase family protein